MTVISLTACGYQLQGAFSPPAGMAPVYIASGDRNSLFYREFVEQMLTAGVELTDSEAESASSFTIFADDTGQRVLSVSARNVPTEYEVFYTITYSLDSGANALMPRQTLTLTRDYTYDSTLVLGKLREEELLREAIVEDLVGIVMKQISTL
jgi:LPS-assembly lipoprotein